MEFFFVSSSVTDSRKPKHFWQADGHSFGQQIIIFLWNPKVLLRISPPNLVSSQFNVAQIYETVVFIWYTGATALWAYSTGSGGFVTVDSSRSIPIIEDQKLHFAWSLAFYMSDIVALPSVQASASIVLRAMRDANVLCTIWRAVHTETMLYFGILLHCGLFTCSFPSSVQRIREVSNWIFHFHNSQFFHFICSIFHNMFRLIRPSSRALKLFWWRTLTLRTVATLPRCYYSPNPEV
jgi:hypothetical protein